MNRFFAKAAIVLLLAELILMFVSWLLSAAMPMSGIRSMLSGEGLRWFFGSFVDCLASPLLIWLLLLAMAWGALGRCGILSFLSSPVRPIRQRRALVISLVTLAVLVAVVLLMTAVPHAVLLSASGSLLPSPFSRSIVPIVAFALVVLAVVYGIIAGTFDSATSVYNAIVAGLCRWAPLLPLYVLVTQFYYSLLFVLP